MVYFQGLDEKIILPENCFYYNLGPTTEDLKKYVFDNINLRLGSEVSNLLKQGVQGRTYTEKGLCEKVTLNYEDGSVEKHAFIAYKDNLPPVNTVFVQGHEDGHALMYFGLQDTFRKIIGQKVPVANRGIKEEWIANLGGLYAIEKKGLLDKLDSKSLAYYSMLKK